MITYDNMSSIWADQPYALISTESFSKDVRPQQHLFNRLRLLIPPLQQSHGANYAATQMALAHNGIIRGLNAIYLQSIALPFGNPTIVQDFLTYCQCWCESMHHHHDVEEETFFPSIEKLTSQPGLMSDNVEQHRAFTPGFEAFQEYVRTCPMGEYDGKKIRSLIEAFAEPLTQHLRDEIDTLRALDKYESEKVRQAYNQMDKLMRESDNVRIILHTHPSIDVADRLYTDCDMFWQQRIVPLVFGTADNTFEGGRHDFPAVPFFVPYIIHHVFERKNRGAWRFNPSTSWRTPRKLAFEPDGSRRE